MSGGLARHPDMSKDGFTLVACHELGHHIGGAPKHKRFSEWASTEGQSDYFAALKCMRRVFHDDDNAGIVKDMELPEVLRDVCDRQFSDANDAAICVRSIVAGMSVAKVFGDLAERQGIVNTAAFNMVNTSAVSTSYDMHPRTQCRFDTIRAGSFCPISYLDRVSQRDPNTSTCTESAGYHKLTARPACWYRAD